ncbi:hypothetical protein EDC04DRAFT_2915543 [Pisolithus marmoratus]|nr:hypothetical protein EDC04DRAFT_2915543 [Pisolithus marmoratus]
MAHGFGKEGLAQLGSGLEARPSTTLSPCCPLVVAVFHSFKTHLHPVAVNTDTGKVRQGWLHLYQNNLYVHLCSQLKATSPVVPSTTTTDPVAELQAEISSLQDKFYKYIATHEACCRCSNPTPSASSEDGSNEESTHSPPPSPCYILRKIEDNAIEVFINPPTWLATVLRAPDLPTRFTGNLVICCPVLLGSPPRDALEAIKLKFGGSSPFYLRVGQNGHLTVSATADHSLVTNSFLPNPSVPTARP